jgi:hypothetical protein
MKRSGIYIIHIIGTPFIYVGEADDIDRRYRRHYNEWIWPNQVYLHVIEMPGSTKAERIKAEADQMRSLRSREFIVLSTEVGEAGKRNIQKANRERTPEQRKALTAKARAAVTPEGKIRRGEKLRAFTAERTKEWILARNQRSWATRRARYGRNGLKA